MLKNILAILFIIAIFVIANKKKKRHKEMCEKRENMARTTARPEDVLTEGGIPKRTEPRPPRHIHTPDNAPQKTESFRAARAISPAVNDIRAKAEKFARQPPAKHIFDPYLQIISFAGSYVSRELKQDIALNPDNCILCRKPTMPDDSRVSLTNGAHVHKTCYEAMRRQVRSWRDDNNFIIKAENSRFFERIMMVNDYWPTYPDDWESRKCIILNRAQHECESCGEDGKPLHVHHIEELSAGGSNLLSNLICLCEDCHNEIHDGLLAKNIDIRKGKNRTKIDDAINRDRDIEFTYKDVEGNYTRRRAKPIRYVKTPHGASAIRAFCYLRNEERTFVIRKMSKMKVL